MYFKTMLFFVGMLQLSCLLHDENEQVFKAYKNYSAIKKSNTEEYFSNDYIVKAKNTLSTPIVIPYTIYGLLPVTYGYNAQVKEDSLINISGFGTRHIYNLGIDTLLPGETQRYFAQITEWDWPRDRDSYSIVCFTYYLLEDFSEYSFNSDFKQSEFFILYRDSLDIITIYKTDSGFNPEIDESYPIPNLK